MPGRSCYPANCTGNCGRAHSDPSTSVKSGKQNSPVTASSRNRNRKFRENPTSKSRAQKKPFRRGDCCQKIAQRKGQISLFGLFHKVIFFIIFLEKFKKKRFNRSSRRKRDMAPNLQFIITDFFWIFLMNFNIANIVLKEMGKFLWEKKKKNYKISCCWQ